MLRASCVVCADGGDLKDVKSAPSPSPSSTLSAAAAPTPAATASASVSTVSTVSTGDSKATAAGGEDAKSAVRLTLTGSESDSDGECDETEAGFEAAAFRMVLWRDSDPTKPDTHSRCVLCGLSRSRVNKFGVSIALYHCSIVPGGVSGDTRSMHGLTAPDWMTGGKAVAALSFGPSFQFADAVW